MLPCELSNSAVKLFIVRFYPRRDSYMNKKRFIWLVPVLVMAFAMAACNNDDDGGGGIGNKLSFSGEDVYTKAMTPYSGADITFTSNAGSSGLITKGGKMTFSIETPSRLIPIETFIMDSSSKLDGGLNIMSRAEYTDGTKIIILDFSPITLNKILNNETVKETVLYIYVDRDCEIKASGIPSANSGGVTVNISNFTLDLKKGWNAVTRMLMATTAGETLVIGKSSSADLKNCNWVYE
jgi:hypothetical protein